MLVESMDFELASTLHELASGDHHGSHRHTVTHLSRSTGALHTPLTITTLSHTHRTHTLSYYYTRLAPWPTSHRSLHKPLTTMWGWYSCCTRHRQRCGDDVACAAAERSISDAQHRVCNRLTDVCKKGQTPRHVGKRQNEV
jgi:hypothetical protein